MIRLDHIMYAVSDLQDGIDEIFNLTGVTAEFGGTHPGNGTRNALLSFDDSQYLEIIAPDVEQDLAGTLGEELQRHDFSGIRTWAVAVDGFALVTPVLDEFGYQYSGVSLSRTRAHRLKVSLQVLFLRRPADGYFWPFFIDCRASPPPAKDTPGGCTLDAFAVELVAANNPYRDLMQALEIEVEVLEGPDAMRAVIDSPNGRILLH